jgi:hypothetical protein
MGAIRTALRCLVLAWVAACGDPSASGRDAGSDGDGGQPDAGFEEDTTAVRPVILAEDGSWCWFQDERALWIGQRLVVSTLSREGDVLVNSYDLDTGERRGAVLARLERDDHDVASLLLRGDGRLLAFYTNHTHDRLMRWRVSQGTGGDVSSWEPERTFDTGGGVCYSNPFELPAEAETGAPPPIFNFYRSLAISPTFSRSTDGGASWSPSARIIHSFDSLRTHRPYVKYASDGVSTVHLAYTEGLPAEWNGTPGNPSANSIYHLYYQGGKLHRSDGEVVANMAAGQSLDLAPTQGTRVYDGNTGETGEAWTHDMTLDPDGNPVIAYAAFPDQTDEFTALGDHRYRYARWDGSRWNDHQVAFAGRGLSLRSRLYSGGIAIDPDDVDVVYFASSVDPTDGSPHGTGRFEIYRGRTADGGATWAFQAVTRDSIVDNLRPIVPAHHPTATALLWLQGVYDEFLYDYNQQVVGLFGPADARADERRPQEVVHPVARFDIGSASAAAGFVAVVPAGSTAAASDGPVELRLQNIAGVRDRVRGGLLHEDFVYNGAGGTAPGDKLRLQLSGLSPDTEYLVSLHQYDPDYHALAEAYWFDGAATSLGVRGNPRFLGAHRLVQGTAHGAGALVLALRSDAGGAIRLVGRGGGAGEPLAVLNGVEVAERPAADAVARFDVEGGAGSRLEAGHTALAFDCASARSGSASAGGVTLTVRTDRLDCLRRRAMTGPRSALLEDFAFADDELVAEVDGLEPGARYEVTVHAVDVEFGEGHAAMWWLEETGGQPVVVRAYHYNGATGGAAASFTFHHRASEPSFTLRGHDLIRNDGAIDSVVTLSGLEIRRVR